MATTGDGGRRGRRGFGQSLVRVAYQHRRVWMAVSDGRAVLLLWRAGGRAGLARGLRGRWKQGPAPASSQQPAEPGGPIPSAVLIRTANGRRGSRPVRVEQPVPRARQRLARCGSLFGGRLDFTSLRPASSMAGCRPFSFIRPIAAFCSSRLPSTRASSVRPNICDPLKASIPVAPPSLFQLCRRWPPDV